MSTDESASTARHEPRCIPEIAAPTELRRAGRSDCWQLLLMATMAPLLSSIAHSQQSEALFAVDSPNQLGLRLLELDSQSGAVVRTIPYVDSFVGERALTYAQDRVVILGRFGIGTADRLIRAHPADGLAQHLQHVSSPWSVHAIDYDGQTGIIRGICFQQPVGGWYGCQLSPATGAATIGAQITSINGITALAINAAGEAFITAAPGATLYRLDMTTGSATLLGSLGVPTSVAWDLAFDSSDRLWASLDDVVTGADTGLYTVDPVTYQATKVISVIDEYYGITFGPKTLATSFCSAKSSSLGCAPRLSGDGFASPAASLGFTVTASDLNNNRVGMMLYTTSGRASIPFQGALLCVQPPVLRSPAGTTGGNPLPTLDCSGTWSIDYNSMIRPRSTRIPPRTLRCSRRCSRQAPQCNANGGAATRGSPRPTTRCSATDSSSCCLRDRLSTSITTSSRCSSCRAATPTTRTATMSRGS